MIYFYLGMKSVRIRSFSGSYFPAFRLNMERSLRIQFECGKIQTRKTPNKDFFHAVYMIRKLVVNHWRNLFRPIPGHNTFFVFIFIFENVVSKIRSFIGSSIYRPWLVILLTWPNTLLWRIVNCLLLYTHSSATKDFYWKEI